jgi:hypothetical protein
MKSSDVGHQLIDSVRHSHCLIGGDPRLGVRQRIVGNNRGDLGLQKAFGHLASESAIRLCGADVRAGARGRLGFDFGRSSSWRAITRFSLAAAFANGTKSNDVATLIEDTEHGAASASDRAEQAR